MNLLQTPTSHSWRNWYSRRIYCKERTNIILLFSFISNACLWVVLDVRYCGIGAGVIMDIKILIYPCPTTLYLLRQSLQMRQRSSCIVIKYKWREVTRLLTFRTFIFKEASQTYQIIHVTDSIVSSSSRSKHLYTSNGSITSGSGVRSYACLSVGVAGSWNLNLRSSAISID